MPILMRTPDNQTPHQATISTIATTESKVTTPTIRYSLITQTSLQATVNLLTMLTVGLRHAADHLSEYEYFVHLCLLNRLPWSIGLVV